MAKEIVAIENTGGTAKLLVKDGDNFSHVPLPYGIIRIEPKEINDEFISNANNNLYVDVKSNNK
tara:strand:+ start:592 stop:783 length:192 start_codon:yes stop_codon:yes gene_type:complete